MPADLYVGLRKDSVYYSFAEVLLGQRRPMIVVWPVSQIFELRLPKLPLVLQFNGQYFRVAVLLFHTSGRGPENPNNYFQVASRSME